jgi:lipid-binding SYLF domain-containing protein
MTTQTLAHRLIATLGVSGALLLSQAALAATTAEKQAELRKMCDEALAVLYKAKPEAKAAVEKSAGYGCFTSFGMSFFVGGAGGQGLVHSNATKKVTYMKMGQASGGLDFGIKDYREVLVFKDAATLAQFVDKGWEFGASGSATAMAGGKGATKEDAATAGGKIEVYSMTKTGLAVGVAAAARKYWKDDELNAAK